MSLATAPLPAQDAHDLAALLRGRRVLVLSGAGISTESGIPDYRSPKSLERPRNPIRYQEFVRDEAARRRYWARSLLGWPHIERAKPNRGHHALADLEAGGNVTGVITQNVDGLHQAAGSRSVLELHGSLAVVRCLACQKPESRRELQTRMLELNPDFGAHTVEIAPDGDADIPQGLIEGFRVPACSRCGGVLKAGVVFFGENVPKDRVERAYGMLDRTEVLLVVGTSLTVFSGYRFVVRAVRQQKPIAIVNQGPTRGDADALLRVSGLLGEVLPELANALVTPLKVRRDRAP
jgi:NAD+-dependent protein deacetylase sirtuin 4